MRQLLAAVGLALLVCAWAAAADSPPDDSPGAPGASVRQWEVVFPDGINTREYAEQLDFFQIEIGAVAASGKTEYISHVSSRKPDKRLGEAAQDPRWRTSWRKGTLHSADRALLTKAGINPRDKLLLHFFPADLQSRLKQLERAYAHRDPSEIKRTRFEVRPRENAGGFEFVVIEQDPPRSSRDAAASRNTPAKP